MDTVDNTPLESSALNCGSCVKPQENGEKDGIVEVNGNKEACCKGINEDFNRATDLNNRSVLAKKSDLIVSFGEILIDFVPTVSGISLPEAMAFKKAPGGAPANVAVGIARLGGHAAFIGKVGDDDFGHMLASILRENGVDDKGILFDGHARTALSFVTLRSDGEREFLFYRNPSADMLLTEAELNRDLIQQACIFHYGSISLISEPSRSAHLAALKIAKDAGALLSYDPNLRLPLWPSAEEARKGIFSIWDKADLIKVSDGEVTFLTDGGDYENDEVVMSLMHPGLKLLIVTVGGKGCRYYAKDFRGRINGFAVKTVDTTGAGDAFVGAFLSEMVKDMSLLEDEKRLREVLIFSNAAAAITTTEMGAVPALPNRAAVMSFLSKVQAS